MGFKTVFWEQTIHQSLQDQGKCTCFHLNFMKNTGTVSRDFRVLLRIRRDIRQYCDTVYVPTIGDLAYPIGSKIKLKVDEFRTR
jgi:hypothetical protein